MRDSLLKQRMPVAILLAVIAIISLWDWQQDLSRWWMVPVDLVTAWESVTKGDFSRETLATLATGLTAAFFHGDLSHLSGNLLFLWLFGVVVCELCGWRWMVAAFLITAIGGSVGQTLLDLDSPVPCLGASGGVMGMEGFYFGLAFQRPRPDSHVWPLSRPVSSGQLAAAGVVGVSLDFIGVMGPDVGIGFGAHIGGFVTGMLLSLVADRMIR